MKLLTKPLIKTTEITETAFGRTEAVGEIFLWDFSTIATRTPQCERFESFLTRASKPFLGEFAGHLSKSFKALTLCKKESRVDRVGKLYAQTRDSQIPNASDLNNSGICLNRPSVASETFAPELCSNRSHRMEGDIKVIVESERNSSPIVSVPKFFPRFPWLSSSTVL